MKISSQTSDLVISPELAEKNLHLFSDAGFDALDFGFCDIYTSEQIYKCERSEVFDLPAEKFDDYFLKIKEMQRNSAKGTSSAVKSRKFCMAQALTWNNTAMSRILPMRQFIFCIWEEL